MMNIESDKLVQFYFGELSSKRRENIEQELLNSPQKLKAYFELKSNIELEPQYSFAPKPDLQIRKHLRQRVSQRGRRIGVSQWIAGAGVTSLILAMSFLVFIHLKAPAESQEILVDSTYRVSANLNRL